MRFFSFVEFPYEGKKLAAYAEKRVCTIRIASTQPLRLERL